MRYAFKLYVYGQTGTSIIAERNIRELIEEIRDIECSLEIIDILTSPEKSMEDKIIATPTLVRTDPQPQIKLIGDMSDTDFLKAMLGFR